MDIFLEHTPEAETYNAGDGSMTSEKMGSLYGLELCKLEHSEELMKRPFFCSGVKWAID